MDFSRVVEIDAKTRKIVWEYADDPPFSFYTVMGVNPRLGGRMNLVFRVHRYGADHAALKNRVLDPNRFWNLNRLYAGGC